MKNIFVIIKPLKPFELHFSLSGFSKEAFLPTFLGQLLRLRGSGLIERIEA